MDKGIRQTRYRGPRPLPLWWFRVKYVGGMLVFGAFIAFASVQVLVAFLTGEVSDFANGTDTVFRWSSQPWRFAGYLSVWLGMVVLSFGGFWLYLSKFVGLGSRSAETRL